MATDMDQPYREWSHEEMPGDSQDVPLRHVLDHGSISFGRFAVESLSWEKWSVFSHNRCQEEIEKFKAPGIVAQKKAYFEEYYKRIRELKALQREQDRQDTAAALGSGGDGSVCSKGGEEHNAEADDTISVVTSHSLLPEETTADVSIEKEKSFSDGFQFQYLVKEPMIPVVDSSTVSDVRIEKIEQPKIGCNNLWNECGTRKGECPVAIAECLELESATQATVSEQTETITQSDSNIPQEKDQISDQVVLSTLKHKGCTSISKDTASSTRNSASLKNDSVYKEAVVTLAKKNVTADHRSKGGGVKPSQGFKHPLGKPAYRTESSVNSRKTTSSKDVPNNCSTSMSSNRHFMEQHSNTMVPLPILLPKERQASGSNRTRDDVPGHSDSKASNRLARLPPGHSRKMSHSQMAVSSDRPLKEVRSNITVPRPFTFSTEKRAAAPASTRDSSQRHSVSKASNRLDQLTGRKKSMPYVQNTSVEIAVKGGMRGTSLATRRSINPHLKGHSNQQRGHEPSPRSSLTSNDMGKKQIEVKEEPEFRRFPQSLKFVGSQLPSFSKNGTSKLGHRKLQIIPSRCADQKGGLKSRQVMPCWR